MNKYSFWLFIGVLWLARPLGAQAELSAEAAREAIRLGIMALRADQDAIRGTWPEYGRFKGGTTALCTLSLLNAGVPRDDPQLAAALNALRKMGNPETTYATSLQTMVFCAANPEKDRLLIRRNVNWLESIQVTTQRGEGGWSYDDRRNAVPDNSNSQFAILALNEAQRVGVQVNRKVWERAVRYWQSRQLKDGSWGYRSNKGKGSMTSAGIASLIIAQRNLSQGDAFVMGRRVVCCGLQQDDNAVQRGLAWLGRNFSVSHNPSADPTQSATWLFYYLYGVERVGRLSGNRYIGEHDWYREGAQFLIEKQTLKGEWVSRRHFESEPHITTALAMLFVAKGRRPVLLSKLKHLPDGDWNRHRQDIGNLTRYVERRWRRDMTWQVIDHQRATVEDLLQTPILFLSGRDGLRMATREKDSLREYVNQGGFLFVEACCGGEAFDRDLRQLMAELFPDNPLRLLPPDHPIWYAEQRVDTQYLRPLYGIDTCCRTSVVYCPDNLGCFWELARGEGLQYPAEIQAEIDAVLGIGANVVAYATNRELRDKLDTPPVVIGDEGGERILRGTLSVAKLQHAGGSDDAPAAVANLLRAAGTQLQLRVNTQRLLLPPTDPNLPDFPLVFLHGRRGFAWTDEQRAALAEFVENGGVLFGDAICASSEFAASLRREMEEIFPDSPLKRIPPDHPIFTEEYKGFDLQQVRLRRPRSRNAQGALEARIEQVTPVLEGVEVDGRYVVIFSPYDLSCALESSASTDCEGYISQDAARIGMNVLLYALQQ